MFNKRRVCEGTIVNNCTIACGAGRRAHAERCRLARADEVIE
jgi:hypothetical protein